MIGGIGGIDIEGNLYGTDFSHDDVFYNNTDDSFNNGIDDTFSTGMDDSFNSSSDDFNDW